MNRYWELGNRFISDKPLKRLKQLKRLKWQELK